MTFIGTENTDGDDAVHPVVGAVSRSFEGDVSEVFDFVLSVFHLPWRIVNKALDWTRLEYPFRLD